MKLVQSFNSFAYTTSQLSWLAHWTSNMTYDVGRLLFRATKNAKAHFHHIDMPSYINSHWSDRVKFQG